MANPTERKRLQELIARFQAKSESAVQLHLYGRSDGFAEAANILRAELDKLAQSDESDDSDEPVFVRACESTELINVLTQWKDSGGNVGEVMIALDYFLRERVPEIVAYTLRRGK